MFVSCEDLKIFASEKLIFFVISISALPHRRIVVALYNYNAREETDVSFVKGDRMEVLDDTESDWWRVTVSVQNVKTV